MQAVTSGEYVQGPKKKNNNKIKHGKFKSTIENVRSEEWKRQS